MPDLPSGPDDMTENWFLDLYKGDKVVRTPLNARTVFPFDLCLLSAARRYLCTLLEFCLKLWYNLEKRNHRIPANSVNSPLLAAGPKQLF